MLIFLLLCMCVNLAEVFANIEADEEDAAEWLNLAAVSYDFVDLDMLKRYYHRVKERPGIH